MKFIRDFAIVMIFYGRHSDDSDVPMDNSIKLIDR